MINLDSVKKVCFVFGNIYNLSKSRGVGKSILDAIITPRITEKGVYLIPVHDYPVNEEDTTAELIKKLSPLIVRIDELYEEAIQEELNNDAEGVQAEHTIDPKIVFIIDTSNKTGAALARLFQGPWGGSPFVTKHAIAMDFSEKLSWMHMF